MCYVPSYSLPEGLTSSIAACRVGTLPRCPSGKRLEENRIGNFSSLPLTRPALYVLETLERRTLLLCPASSALYRSHPAAVSVLLSGNLVMTNFVRLSRPLRCASVYLSLPRAERIVLECASFALPVFGVAGSAG